LNDTDMS